MIYFIHLTLFNMQHLAGKFAIPVTNMYDGNLGD